MGHAQRDVAIAGELCWLHPDLEIDWLALNRYRAGRRMDYASSDPDAIAAEMGRVVDYRPVETDGPARAAILIARLVRGAEGPPSSSAPNSHP